MSEPMAKEGTALRRWLAMALALLGFGIGHFSLGRWRAGLAWALCSPLLAAAATVTLWAVAIGALLRVICLLDCARKLEPPWSISRGLMLAGGAWIACFTLNIAQRAWLSQSFSIVSGSAQPTLLVGDTVLVDSLAARQGPPAAGTLVVYTYPCDDTISYVGRVVGLPGQSVGVDAAGFATVDGQSTVGAVVGEWVAPIASPYAGSAPTFVRRINRVGAKTFETLHTQRAAPSAPPDRPAHDWPAETRYRMCDLNQPRFPFPWRVPPGHVFILGDNRQNAMDSRFWGFVPLDAVHGHVEGIWFSQNSAASFFERVRWSRLLTRVQ